MTAREGKGKFRLDAEFDAALFREVVDEFREAAERASRFLAFAGKGIMTPGS